MGTFFCYHCPMNYEAVIGLEIHAELNTKTKMFCFSPNDPDEQHPNINICPICMGHPGTLPFINEDAVKKVIAVGLALSGTMKPSDTKSMQNDFQKVMGMQLKYVFPFIIGAISYSTSGAIALYFITTNLAGAFQELYVRRALNTDVSNKV